MPSAPTPQSLPPAPIQVTKAYLPDKEKYKGYIDTIYESGWLTNNGPLVKQLEQRLQEYLGVKHLILVSNGTLALQVAYKALDLQGEVITTPFSFVATTSSLAWEGLTPIFADIDPNTLNMNPANIEPLITSRTSAILPVHVFGNPCEVEAIQQIAQRHNLKVIYDAAHAFGVQYKGESILNYGDISTLSFHATKLFHTIEGGALITNDDKVAARVRKLINFGIIGPDQIDGVGINAKMNEFQAAMGLCVLDEIQEIMTLRKHVWQRYRDTLQSEVQFQELNANGTQNYSYFPVVFKTEQQLLEVQGKLNQANIYPRRYFYPSLDNLDYLEAKQTCNVSRDIASRILCLPIFPALEQQQQNIIITIICEYLS
ncbi:DegT/DnrJ/EryC1/StrS family aminotransferase [Desulfurispirillum indicum]|uniref:DegT/DnrJ/EryC1/StrS family aminotransferase n=1 Tax=Desulfurispirillum indicum TaxID=936456 RepID=UPI001CF9E4E9|nr:DegT/DnrJ/EryC1/StrS family aminotransferase [Desulfurispirillum indicum]UCZ56534.1 DegT/DnrJ/EryC1/StrS family aminotransferase [Desulfurispirillum indicum]